MPMRSWFRHAALPALLAAAAVRPASAADSAAYPSGKAREYAAAAAAFGELCVLRERLRFFEAMLARRAAYAGTASDAAVARRAESHAVRADLCARIAEHVRVWRMLAAPGAADPEQFFTTLAADLRACKERAQSLLDWARGEKLRLPGIPEQVSFHIGLHETLRFGVLVRRWRDDAFPAWRVLGFDHVGLPWADLPRRGEEIDYDALRARLDDNARAGLRTFLRHEIDGPVDFSIWEISSRVRWQQTMRRLDAALGAHEALLGYALFCGADNRPASEERGPDGASADAAFREFLRQRYGTIGALNTAWPASFSDFGAIAGPPGARLKSYGPVYHDFARFRQESLTEFVGGCIRALGTSGVRRLVMVELDETAGKQDTFLAASLPVGCVACDAPAGEPRDFRASQAFGIARATGKALWRDRFFPMAPEGALGANAETLGAAINRNIWQTLAAGAHGMLLWSLDGEASDGDALLDRESAWCVIRPESARVPIAIDLARALEPEILQSAAEEPEIGILDSARTRLFPPACAAQRETRAAVERLLAEEGWSYVVLPEASLATRPESLKKLRAIVAPGCAYVLGEAAAALERYAATGGLLVAAGRGGFLDEVGRPTALSSIFLAARRTVGRGAALRIDDVTAERDALASILTQVLGPPRIVVTPRGAAEAFLRKDAKATYLFLINSSAREPVDARVTLGLKFATAEDLVARAPVPIIRASGARNLVVPLEPGGVAVLKLETDRTP